MKYIISALVKNQKCSNQKLIKEAIRSFEGKNIRITIEKLKSKRSDAQNKLWWLYMTILSKELGYTKEEIHEICKFKFLKRERVNEKTGEILEYLASTTSLNKSEFADMVTDLIRWSSETFSIVLPDPNEQVEMEMD